MSSGSTPVSIGKRAESPHSVQLDVVLGQAAADVLRLHRAVIDREDRLESGTGAWLQLLGADEAARAGAVTESVLRALRMASDATNFAILSLLHESVGTPIADLQTATGLGRLSLSERIGDLVSAGLASKIPEANQVAGTAAGAAIVGVVRSAGRVGGRDLAGGR